MLIKKEREELVGYCEDSSNCKNGAAEILYIPENEEDIVEMLAECGAKNMPVTVSGGGTGTVGGRVPFEGAILSMERFNRINNIDVKAKKASLQSGVIIEDFLAELEKHSLFYPPFPTERTAFVGGNAATNASGEYSYKFGATRKYISRVRMLLSTGNVMEMDRGRVYEKGGIIPFEGLRVPLPSYRTPDIKCAAGYYSKEGMDGIDLIIGSEGTLGIITEVDVSLIDSLPERFILIAFMPESADMPSIIARIKKEFPLLYSLEFFDEGSLRFLHEDFPGMPKGSCAVYVEDAHTEGELSRWIDFLDEIGATDAWTGADAKNYERLIDFRHRLPENINSYFRKIGIVKMSIDAAVPEEKFAELYGFYRHIMKSSGIHTILFGHIGESHLHFNLFPMDNTQQKRAKELYISCLKKVIQSGGTVAAEHGIGKIKHKWLEMMYGEQGIRDMAAIKRIFDPYSILGLDNIFPKELL